jgi:hypothetical protein
VRLLRRWAPAERFPLVASKFGRILDLCDGKDVLDCGCIGDVAESPEEAKHASHEQIARRAKYCLGESRPRVRIHEALGDAPQEHVRGWGATSLAR